MLHLFLGSTQWRHYDHQQEPHHIPQCIQTDTWEFDSPNLEIACKTQGNTVQERFETGQEKLVEEEQPLDINF